MSHCTRFDFSYADEELAVATFYRLNLEPATDAVIEYSSEFAKRYLAPLGYTGENVYRAIVAGSGPYQYFMVKTGDGFELLLEKEGGLTQADEQRIRCMEREFRHAYVAEALDRQCRRLRNTGQPARVVADGATLTLEFGVDYSGSVRVSLLDGRTVEEEVSGVQGTACTDLTAELENLISSSHAELQTTWKAEYTQVLDEQTVQVLRLS